MYYNENKDIKFPSDHLIDFINAVSEGNAIKVREFLLRGMHPNTQGPKGWNALRKAAVKNHYEIALELLMRGASVDTCNHTGQSALMMACAYGHIDMVSLHLFYGANPNHFNSSRKTPLMIAVSHRYTRVAGMLLDFQPRIDLDITDRNGKNALDLALTYGHDAAAKMLLVAGAKGQINVEMACR